MILFNATQKAYYALIPVFILCAALLGLFGCNADASDSEDSSESAASAPQTQYYHIIFHRNDGEMDVTVDVPVAIDGTKFKIPDCTDDRIGFEPTSISVFNYWNTEANGTGESYEIGVKNNFKLKAGQSIDLYAIWNWQPGGYTIVFNANGGSGDMSSQYASFGWRTLSANTFTKTGNTFTGWNTKSDGTGTSYNNSQSVLNLSTENGASVTLYAQWRINKYTVVFDANGGSGTMSSQSMDYGSVYTLRKNTFTKDFRSFDGWSKNADGTGTKYNDEQEVSNLTSEDGVTITLYAVWGVGLPVGSIVYSDKSWTASNVYDNTKTPIGVVFYSDETKVKIVHLQHAGKKWCLETAEAYDKYIATDEADGSSNWQTICSNVTDENVSGNYPVFEYANSLTEDGGGWYVPAYSEVCAFMDENNKPKINAALKTLSDAEVSASSISSSNWTSNINTYTATQAICVVSQSNGNARYGFDKKISYNVRAVKAFNY